MACGMVPSLDRLAHDRGQDSDPSYPVCAPMVAVAKVLALGYGARARVTQAQVTQAQVTQEPVTQVGRRSNGTCRSDTGNLDPTPGMGLGSRLMLRVAHSLPQVHQAWP